MQQLQNASLLPTYEQMSRHLNSQQLFISSDHSVWLFICRWLIKFLEDYFGRFILSSWSFDSCNTNFMPTKCHKGSSHPGKRRDGRVAAAVKKFTMNTSHALILGVMVFASAFHIGHYIIGTESTLRNWLWLDKTYLSWPRHDGDFIIVDDELIRRRLHTSMRKGSFNATYPNIAHFFNHIPKVSKVICAYPLLFILK